MKSSRSNDLRRKNELSYQVIVIIDTLRNYWQNYHLFLTLSIDFGVSASIVQ